MSNQFDLTGTPNHAVACCGMYLPSTKCLTKSISAAKASNLQDLMPPVSFFFKYDIVYITNCITLVQCHEYYRVCCLSSTVQHAIQASSQKIIFWTGLPNLGNDM